MQTIQLYSQATSNGKKIGVALEEMGLPYEAHLINIREGDQHTPEFKAINPNGKIPAIIDPEGPDGKEIRIFESGAILIYLARKSGKLLSTDERIKYETLQWLFMQVGHIGPMFGQFGHFYRNQDKCDHPYPLERYATETKRLLGVLDERLEGRSYLVNDEYSIADIATFPWVWTLSNTYNAGEYLGVTEYTNVERWLGSIMERPAVQKGVLVNALPKK